MKRKLLNCERCNEQTIHLTTKKMSRKREHYRTRRTVKHCLGCNVRTITNMKINKTYRIYYGWEKDTNTWEKISRTMQVIRHCYNTRM